MTKLPHNGMFAFTHNVDILKRGFIQWHQSGWQHKPSREEVESREPSWDADLDTLYGIYKYAEDYPKWKGMMGNIGLAL